MTEQKKTLSEDQKAHLSKTGTVHWDRCKMWGLVLDMPPSDINKRWSSSILPVVCDETWVGNPPTELVTRVKTAIAEQLLVEAKFTKQITDRNYTAGRDKAQKHYDRISEPSKHQPLDSRVKIMLWAIRKCGGANLACDALKRACASLAEPGESDAST